MKIKLTLKLLLALLLYGFGSALVIGFFYILFASIIKAFLEIGLNH